MSLVNKLLKIILMGQNFVVGSCFWGSCQIFAVLKGNWALVFGYFESEQFNVKDKLHFL